MINMTNFPLIKHICSKMALNWTTFTCQAELLTTLLKSHFKITFPLQFIATWINQSTWQKSYFKLQALRKGTCKMVGLQAERSQLNGTWVREAFLRCRGPSAWTTARRSTTAAAPSRPWNRFDEDFLQALKQTLQLMRNISNWFVGWASGYIRSLEPEDEGFDPRNLYWQRKDWSGLFAITENPVSTQGIKLQKSFTSPDNSEEGKYPKQVVSWTSSSLSSLNAVVKAFEFAENDQTWSSQSESFYSGR